MTIAQRTRRPYTNPQAELDAAHAALIDAVERFDAGMLSLEGLEAAQARFAAAVRQFERERAS